MFPNFAPCHTTHGRYSSFYEMLQCETQRTGCEWTLFSCHPWALSCICTTELLDMVAKQEEFLKRDCKLVVFSCDSEETQWQWAADILALFRHNQYLSSSAIPLEQMPIDTQKLVHDEKKQGDAAAHRKGRAHLLTPIPQSSQKVRTGLRSSAMMGSGAAHLELGSSHSYDQQKPARPPSGNSVPLYNRITLDHEDTIEPTVLEEEYTMLVGANGKKRPKNYTENVNNKGVEGMKIEKSRGNATTQAHRPTKKEEEEAMLVKVDKKSILEDLQKMQEDHHHGGLGIMNTMQKIFTFGGALSSNQESLPAPSSTPTKGQTATGSTTSATAVDASATMTNASGSELGFGIDAAGPIPILSNQSGGVVVGSFNDLRRLDFSPTHRRQHQMSGPGNEDSIREEQGVVLDVKKQAGTTSKVDGSAEATTGAGAVAELPVDGIPRTGTQSSCEGDQQVSDQGTSDIAEVGSADDDSEDDLRSAFDAKNRRAPRPQLPLLKPDLPGNTSGLRDVFQQDEDVLSGVDMRLKKVNYAASSVAATNERGSIFFDECNGVDDTASAPPAFPLFDDCEVNAAGAEWEKRREKQNAAKFSNTKRGGRRKDVGPTVDENGVSQSDKESWARLSVPIVADPERHIARQLGMLDNNDVKKASEFPRPVRGMYLIDPHGIVKMIINLPIMTGRDLREPLRVLDASRLVHACPFVGTPARWHKGGRVVLMPGVSPDIAAEDLKLRHIRVAQVYGDSKYHSYREPQELPYLMFCDQPTEQTLPDWVQGFSANLERRREIEAQQLRDAVAEFGPEILGDRKDEHEQNEMDKPVPFTVAEQDGDGPTKSLTDSASQRLTLPAFPSDLVVDASATGKRQISSELANTVSSSNTHEDDDAECVDSPGGEAHRRKSEKTNKKKRAQKVEKPKRRPQKTLGYTRHLDWTQLIDMFLDEANVQKVQRLDREANWLARSGHGNSAFAQSEQAQRRQGSFAGEPSRTRAASERPPQGDVGSAGHRIKDNRKRINDKFGAVIETELEDADAKQHEKLERNTSNEDGTSNEHNMSDKKIVPESKMNYPLQQEQE
ncbi:unnamed protein product [Amoebophrya sp. A120]|nr:unnamed protein product [Amoebophrya sp. A120]|eukprot:GSA120T00021697001.1